MSAPTITPDALARAVSAAPVVTPAPPAPGERRILLRSLDSYESKPTEWLWPGRIPAAELTILAGDGGLGKSTLAAWIAAQVTTGRMRGSTGTRRVCVLLGEDDPARVLKARYRAARNEMGAVHIVAAGDSDKADARTDDFLSLPDDLPALGARMRELKPDLLIVDPLTAYLGGSVDAHRDGGQGGMRAVLNPLARLAQEHGVTVLCCVHLNKGQGPSRQRIAGSGAVVNTARNVLMLAAHPEARESGDDDGRRVLGHEKCNVGPTTATLDLELRSAPAVGDDGRPLTQSDGSAATTSTVYVGAESEVDYRDALAAAGAVALPEAGGSRADAEDFLRQMLADGPVPVTQLNTEATQVGISERTLKRARKQLGVLAIKGANGWTVQLPESRGPLERTDESPASTGGIGGSSTSNRAKGANGAKGQSVAPLAPLPATDQLPEVPR